MANLERYFREEVEPILQYMVDQATELINELDINASGDLIESLNAYLDDKDNIQFEFNDYGLVQDQGLNPVGGGPSPYTAIAASGSTRVFREEGITRGIIFTPSNGEINIPDGTVPVLVPNLERWLMFRNFRAPGLTIEQTAYLVRRIILINGYEGREWVDEVIFDPRLDDLMAEAFDTAVQRDIDDNLDFNIDE